jgi:hypothetical protein
VVRTDRELPQFEEEHSEAAVKLHNILLTYAFYNFDLGACLSRLSAVVSSDSCAGYCQGMADLLAPILCMVEDEVDTFWCVSLCSLSVSLCLSLSLSVFPSLCLTAGTGASPPGWT